MRIKLLIATLLLSVSTLCAKDLKTVIFTPNPPMSCQNCENKIKGNLRFEKGVKDIQTNLETQEITVTYDADKTSVDNLAVALDKIGYKTTTADCENTGDKPCDKQSKKCCKATEKEQKCETSASDCCSKQ